MTLTQRDRDEIALALLLLKFKRTEYRLRGGKLEQDKRNGDLLSVPLNSLELITERILSLARKIGVNKEFINLLLQHPVSIVHVEYFEPWTDEKVDKHAKRTSRIKYQQAARKKAQLARLSRSLVKKENLSASDLKLLNEVNYITKDDTENPSNEISTP